MINVFELFPEGKIKRTKKETNKLKQIQKILNQSEREIREKQFLRQLMIQESWVVTPLPIVQVECDKLPYHFDFNMVDTNGVFVKDLIRKFKTSDCYMLLNMMLGIFEEKYSPERTKKFLKDKFNYVEEKVIV